MVKGVDHTGAGVEGTVGWSWGCPQSEFCAAPPPLWFARRPIAPLNHPAFEPYLRPVVISGYELQGDVCDGRSFPTRTPTRRPLLACRKEVYAVGGGKTHPAGPIRYYKIITSVGTSECGWTAGRGDVEWDQVSMV